MSDPVFLIDVGRGDDSRRFVGESVSDILRLLACPGVDLDLDYLRVERLRPVPSERDKAA